MKRGPVLAAGLLGKVLSIDSSPKPATSLLVEICLGEECFSTDIEAREAAERWASDFLATLRREVNRSGDLGRPCFFVFNSSSEYMIQGAAYEEPQDSPALKRAKTNRRRFGDYISTLRSLNPRDFEAVCAGILAAFGVVEPVLTPYSADEGIDFYGHLKLRGLLFLDDVLPNVGEQMNIWLVGQAKHYQRGRVSTFEIRDLVGAVHLARAQAFASEKSKYRDLQIRPCDAVFYLIFSTGELSRATWTLIKKSGVIGMDGPMVAAFLADRGIGVENDRFSSRKLQTWIAKYR